MEEDRLNKVTKLTAILTCLSLVIGIVLGIFQVGDSLAKASTTLEKANETLDAIKVEALSNVVNVLDDNYSIRVKQVEMDKGRFSNLEKSANKLLNSGKTGEQVYYSEGQNSFREVASHYERLAALVKLNYLEFQVLFDVIPFPDAFWDNSRELRKLISTNWRAEGEPLNDYLSGFTRLCELYMKERRSLGYKSGKEMMCN